MSDMAHYQNNLLVEMIVQTEITRYRCIDSEICITINKICILDIYCARA